MSSSGRVHPCEWPRRCPARVGVSRPSELRPGVLGVDAGSGGVGPRSRAGRPSRPRPSICGAPWSRTARLRSSRVGNRNKGSSLGISGAHGEGPRRPAESGQGRSARAFAETTERTRSAGNQPHPGAPDYPALASSEVLTLLSSPFDISSASRRPRARPRGSTVASHSW